ncbi:MAG: SDR family NAD(P)-dependent oxidoreductase, partial [Actinomycetota bacterium]
MTVELKGKVAAITGGARGIGKAIAEAFVAEGMSVAIGDLDLELAQATAKELGDRAVAFELDVTVPASMEAFVRSTEQAFGPLDVMVNNAGIMVVGDFLKEDDRATDLQIDVNVRGVMHGCRAFLPLLRRADRGHIVNVASMIGLFAAPPPTTYTRDHMPSWADPRSQDRSDVVGWDNGRPVPMSQQDDLFRAPAPAPASSRSAPNTPPKLRR